MCTYLQTKALDGKTVSAASRFTDAHGAAGDQIVTPTLDFGTPRLQFTVRLYRYDSDPRTIKAEVTGTDGTISKKIDMDMAVTKDNQVMNYAVASRAANVARGRCDRPRQPVQQWKYQNISPFNITSDSKVDGTIGTILDQR